MCQKGVNLYRAHHSFFSRQNGSQNLAQSNMYTWDRKPKPW
uniref:Uncharacterized protein n=1 Tax=Arundo donax TaxID=35708 RepID=A0A0A8ZXY4_ARUDO